MHALIHNNFNYMDEQQHICVEADFLIGLHSSLTAHEAALSVKFAQITP